jgi:outer membrane usher protein
MARRRRNADACIRVVAILRLIGGLAALVPHALAAQEARDATRSLQLEVFVNGHPRNLIAKFSERADGRLASPSSELSEIGVRTPKEGGSEEEEVALDAIPGLSYEYDVAKQQIRLTLAPQAMAERVYKATPGSDKTQEAPLESSFGGLLNYHLRSSVMRDPRGGFDYQGASANFDARVFSDYGVVKSGAIVGSTVANRFTQVRLDTNYTYADDSRLMNYVVGDTIAPGPAWSRSIRLAGVQIQRNFGLRPDLVTAALPSVSGSAAVPSTVDVYVNNNLTISQPVDEGPYRIDAIPVAGDGTTRVLTRDATGRVIETSTPFMVSSKILKQGAFDWSFEAGLPRQYYAIQSNQYAHVAVASGSMRGGLTDWLTLQAHGETSSSRFANASAGASFRILDRAVATLAGGGSYWRGEVGGLIYASLETRLFGVSVSASSQRAFGLFNDLATVTAPTTNAYNQPLASALYSSPWIPGAAAAFYRTYYDGLRPSRALDRVSFSFPAPFDEKTAVNLTFANVTRSGGVNNSRMLTLGLTRTFFDDVTAYLAATYDFANADQRGVFAGLSIPLGGETVMSTSFSPQNTASSVTADVGRMVGQEPGSWGWRVRNTGLTGQAAYREASVGYRHEYGRIDLGASQMGRNLGGYAAAEGSVAAIRGAGVGLGNPISDSFAMVNAGAPGVELLAENRPIGRTNMFGTIVAPNLRAYEMNRLSLNVETLPLDRSIAQTERLVRPARNAGVAVDFVGKRRQAGVTVIMKDASGAFLPPGSRAVLSGAGDAAVVGYDGRLYVPEPQAENEVVVSLDAKECRASFTYAPENGRAIGPVACE